MSVENKKGNGLGKCWLRPQVQCRSRKHLKQFQAHTEVNVNYESWLTSVWDSIGSLHMFKLRKKADMGLPFCFSLEEVKLLLATTDTYLLWKSCLFLLETKKAQCLAIGPCSPRVAIWWAYVIAYSCQYKKKQRKLLVEGVKQEKHGWDTQVKLLPPFPHTWPLWASFPDPGMQI
jgi:hypothetical protein